MNNTVLRLSSREDFRVINNFTKEEKTKIIEILVKSQELIDTDKFDHICLLITKVGKDEKAFHSHYINKALDYLRSQRPSSIMNETFYRYFLYIPAAKKGDYRFWWEQLETSLKYNDKQNAKFIEYNKRTMIQKVTFLQHIINKLRNDRV